MSLISQTMLESCDISVETSSTVDDWQALVDESNASKMSQMFNLASYALLKSCLESGWNPDTEGLGDWYIEHIKDDVKKESSQDYRDFFKDHKDDQAKMLNDYGKAYMKADHIPLIIIRDKKTGKIDDFSEELLENLYFRMWADSFIGKLILETI